MIPLQATAPEPVAAVGGVFALAALSFGLGLGAGLVHRWYAHRRIPDALAVLVGLAGVAAVLNTTTALTGAIGGTPLSGDPLALTTMTYNVVAFLVGGVMAAVGGRSGDRLGGSAFALAGATRVETDVSRVVQAVGRVITVQLPDEIDDLSGYDPVDPETKEKLAGELLVFPRRLTVAELRERLIDRLRTDYGVGRVDLDLADDGSVEYLAVGSRAAGLGPTLPPGSAAVAIRADPAFAASAGDLVAIHRDGERLATGELRGVADDAVTVTVDAADAAVLDPAATHRLVTLPAEPRADREFASLLRAADETMGVIDVAGGSGLAGTSVGELDAAVVAVRTVDGEIAPLPARSRVLVSGETVFVVATPVEIRELSAAAAAVEDH